jgi:uncharacterized protein YycO
VLKSSFVLGGCGYIFYAKLFFPFHMLIVCSILLFFTLYYAIVFFLPQRSRLKVLFLVALANILLTSSYGAFATSRFNSVNLIVPDPRTSDTTFLERAFKSNTLPVYEFLIQKLSDIKLSGMEFQVSEERIQHIRSMLEPGDIILLRKNNYVSNWIIKGFWKHAALYCGSLDEMERYFADESKTVPGSSIKNYLLQRIGPSRDRDSAAAQFKNGAVIESTSKGVNLRAMDKALLSDYLAVLRPRLPRKDKLSAIRYSLDQLEKPYDYHFDFTDDGAFCCSELIYKAFCPHDGTGLAYDLRMVNGRPSISPNDFVEDFDRTYASSDCQYDFILYIEKDQDKNLGMEKNMAAFRASWKKRMGI